MRSWSVSGASPKKPLGCSGQRSNDSTIPPWVRFSNGSTERPLRRRGQRACIVRSGPDREAAGRVSGHANGIGWRGEECRAARDSTRWPPGC
jgi:hypothetical protein